VLIALLDNDAPLTFSELLAQYIFCQVFVMLGGQLHSLPNVGAVVRLGLDFDNTITISDKDMASLPLGEPVPG
jgi:hypothetical protein